MTQNKRVVLAGVILSILLLTGWLSLNNNHSSGGIPPEEIPPEGILYKASQDPENPAYYWSIHEFLLTPGPDMESILGDYDAKYEQYLYAFQEIAVHDAKSLQAIRPEWIPAVGENNFEGYVSGVDLTWPGLSVSDEEAIELFNSYLGQYRAIPVFAPDFSEIVDYFLIGIGNTE